MALTETQIQATYELGKAVHGNKLKRAEALRRLEALGVPAGSASGLIDDLRYMLDGRIYKRTLTGPIAEYFLTSITADFGLGGLRKALIALLAHIEYLDEFRSMADSQERQIYERYVAQLTDLSEITYPDDAPDDPAGYPEGAVKAVLVNQYERNPKARQACLDFHGYDCKVCGFNFSKAYGEHGKDFIHVHHRIPLSKIGKDYQVDAKHDLIPVCPNCHAMLHRGGDVLDVKDLRAMLQRSESSTPRSE